MRPFVVVASGPSAVLADLSIVRGRAIVIAVGESWRLCPWADFLYAADYQWWSNTDPDFSGIAVCPTTLRRRPSAIVQWEDGDCFHTSPMRVGGRNSGFQAVNLAFHLGAARIGLVGFDMHDRAGTHWHKPHKGMPNPTAANMEEWRAAMDAAAPIIAGLGVEVINCSLASALIAYPKMSLEGFMSGDLSILDNDN